VLCARIDCQRRRWPAEPIHLRRTGRDGTRPAGRDSSPVRRDRKDAAPPLITSLPDPLKETMRTHTGEMPHWRPLSVEAETPDVGLSLLLPATTNPEFMTAIRQESDLTGHVVDDGLKLNMSPYFSVMHRDSRNELRL